jgi:squalene-hopene/tetraprenyl-beta-curcumene cyclase
MNPTETYNHYLGLRDKLLAERNTEGYWTGRLSTSALATAVAIVALKAAQHPEDRHKVLTGLEWLLRNVNEDGGFGDSPESLSNVSTTLLCYAAIRFCRQNEAGLPVLQSMEQWLEKQGIALQSQSITRSILDFYGKDYTFSIPILSMLVVCGVLPETALKKIPGLPFELTLLPAAWYRFVNLRVVSYALPALIGVGVYLYINKKNRFRTGIRKWFIKPALKKLDLLVPSSGGFLEAIPLTGFVAMCLIRSGFSENRTVTEGLQFLRKQQRNDGGWPIDTDLSTWVTTLSVKALGSQIKQVLSETEINKLRNHLLQLQYKSVHPFNGAEPGGWGWTSFTGSVPDADDTPGAILALLEVYEGSKVEIAAIEQGCNWLMGLQNRDGGFPTFCKGWGRLPFDSSCADLTGHALLALMKTNERVHRHLSKKTRDALDKSIHMAMGYLIQAQQTEGAWLPLWFGNQHTADKTNPVYGTAKVCIYLNECIDMQYPDTEFLGHLGRMAENARIYLASQQNGDGSWGGKKGVRGTTEETALAVSALAGYLDETCEKGLKWLSHRHEIQAAPIGLYFAMLWYDERLYPLVYHVEALRKYLSL